MTEPAPLETGYAIQRLAGAAQADLGRIVGLLQEALRLMRTLEADARVVPGLAATLKPKAAELALSVEALTDAAAGIPKAMMLTEAREPPPTAPAGREP